MKERASRQSDVTAQISAILHFFYLSFCSRFIYSILSTIQKEESKWAWTFHSPKLLMMVSLLPLFSLPAYILAPSCPETKGGRPGRGPLVGSFVCSMSHRCRGCTTQPNFGPRNTQKKARLKKGEFNSPCLLLRWSRCWLCWCSFLQWPEDLQKHRKRGSISLQCREKLTFYPRSIQAFFFSFYIKAYFRFLSGKYNYVQ